DAEQPASQELAHRCPDLALAEPSAPALSEPPGERRRRRRLVQPFALQEVDKAVVDLAGYRAQVSGRFWGLHLGRLDDAGLHGQPQDPHSVLRLATKLAQLARHL